jgi:hypothetical protein
MPTAARQKYLAKLAAKKADILSEADRQGEYDKVMSQLTQISAPEVDKFEALMSEWVKDAKVRQGVIPIPVIHRALCYSLGISRSKTFVSLRSDDYEKYAAASTAETPMVPKQQTTGAATNTMEPTTQTNNIAEENEEMPQLVSPIRINNEPIISSVSTTDEPSTTNTTEPAQTVIQSGNQHNIHSNNQQSQKAKKKKPVFAQPVPRGSRNASRPSPAMKPKAQSA